MRKFLKIIFSLFCALILTVILVPVVLSILLSSYTVQNYVAKKAARYASDYLGTTVSIDRIRVKLISRIQVDGFYVEDLQGDTLLYVNRLDVGFRGYNISRGMFRAGEVRIDGGSLYLEQDSTLTMNIKYVTEKLKREVPRVWENDFLLRGERLSIKNFRFRLKKYDIPERPYGINFADMDVDSVNIEFRNIGMVNDRITGVVEKISFREKSGFRALEISASEAVASPEGVQLLNLRIRDDYSDIRMSDFRMNYDRWPAFQNFVEEVAFHTDLLSSRVDTRTLAYFAPGLHGKEIYATTRGEIYGPVTGFSGHLSGFKTGNTELDLVFDIRGLPDTENTLFDLDLKRLESTAEELSVIYSEFTCKPAIAAGTLFTTLGRVSLSGDLEGKPNRFSVRGVLTTDPGTTVFTARLSPASRNRTSVQGTFATEEFRIGDLFPESDLGILSLEGSVGGFFGRDSVSLVTEARIEGFDYKGYRYQEITLDGNFRNRYFRGFVGSDDPNLAFRLNGAFDFGKETPEYDFSLDLMKADLARLNINRRDSVSVLSAFVSVNALGSTIDDIEGNGFIAHARYRYNEEEISTGRIDLAANNREGNRHIGLYSDFLDVEMFSRLDLYDIFPHAYRTLQYYLPSLRAGDETDLIEPHLRLDSARTNSPENFYLISAELKQEGRLLSAILPGLHVGEETRFSFLLNPATHNFSMMLESDLIEYKSLYVSNLIVTNRNQADSIAVYLRTDEVGVGNFYMPDLSVVGGVKNNVINMGLGFHNPANRMSAMINTTSRLATDSTGRKEWNLRLNSSYVSMDERQWRLSGQEITVTDSTIHIPRFRVTTQGQEMAVHGTISASRNDTLHFSLQNFDLSPLSGLVDRYGYQVSGRTDGHADLIAARGDRLFYGSLRFSDMTVNDRPVPGTVFSSVWDPDNHRIRTLLRTESGNTLLTGGYQLTDKRFHLNATLSGIDLSFLQPVLDDVLTDINGSADADIRITGTGAALKLNGTITVPSFAATVDFTKARYYLEDAVFRVTDNDLFLENNTVRDDFGGTGSFDMALRTGNFRDLNYDIRVIPHQLVALNTTEADNDLFYGRAFASGTVTIEGGKSGVKMDIVARTENNSTFFLPLTDKASIAEADFLIFEDPGREPKPLITEELPRYRLVQMLRERRRNRRAAGDLDLTMALNILPNTEVQLVIDPTVGDILRGNGNGSLNLRVRPKEELFTMVGDYEIESGSYLFTMRDILNKRFTLEPGSTIQWVGDPVDALLNITATYQVRSSLSGLNIGGLTNSRQNIPVECKLMITDRLTHPDISFDVEIPTGDAEIRNAVQSYLNTDEQKAKQFLSLLILNRFYPDNGSDANFNIGTTTGAVTGLEFLTNQFSNWFSGDRFNINLGYRPKSEISSDELEAAFSSELIPNRLVVEAEANYNLGNTPSATTRTDNQLTGDFAVTYIFDRNLRGKVFTRTIDRYDENQGLQEHGVGLYYRRDFDTVGELFRRKRKKQAEASIETIPLANTE